MSLHDVVETEKYVFLIMEYISGGSLHHYIKKQQPKRRLPEREARRIFAQIVDAIDYCHHKKCITH